MKIVFCGPPHSGKTVFIANLLTKLPTDAYTIIRACPDGEGNWSNNKNQNEIIIVRKKGPFTKIFVDNTCKAIDKQENAIVLIDVGGIISKENEQIFKHCDSFVVLSNDTLKKKEWLEFGQNVGLSCVGCLDSSREGKDEIYSREPYLQGKMVGLERGTIIENSPIINAMVSDIIKMSNYVRKNLNTIESSDYTMIDDTELGFELGYGKEIPVENDKTSISVTWKESAIPQVCQAIKQRVNPNKSVKINGIRANFILCSICKTCKEKGVTDISIFDARSNQYIKIKNLPKEKNIDTSEGLSYKIIENEENIFLDVDIIKEHYSLEDFEKCVLPEINEEKNLYISGRLPHWLLASISNSYDSNRIFTFQPGNGFTCVSSFDEKNLGKKLDSIDGINLNKYFEDKREYNKLKLPLVIKEQDTLYKTIKAKDIILIEEEIKKENPQNSRKKNSTILINSK